MAVEACAVLTAAVGVIAAVDMNMMIAEDEPGGYSFASPSLTDACELLSVPDMKG